jgi:hypothetical protein
MEWTRWIGMSAVAAEKKGWGDVETLGICAVIA